MHFWTSIFFLITVSHRQSCETFFKQPCIFLINQKMVSPFTGESRIMFKPFHNFFLKLLLIVVGFTALTAPGFAHAQSISEEDILVDKARLTLGSFLADPNMEWFRDHVKDARGLLIIPQFIKGAFFIGGSMGNGVLLVQDEKTNEWSYPAFFTLGGASFGFQFGGQASEVVLLVMTQKGVDSMMSTTFKLGADASVAVGPIGAGVEGSTAPNLSADLLSFSRAKGLFAGISLEGAVVAARDARNTSYYNAPTKTIDILVRRNVSNPQADPLLTVVRKATKIQ
jgi:lipid-binding SYLF domain-containing protein